MKPIDLRSDTVTQPTPAMRQAMRDAALGDDVFGDDPSVNALQNAMANKLGFESALLMPSGTQSNLCAILAHCQRGDEYIVGQMAHCYRWEGGGAAVLGSVQPQPLAHASDGTIALADIEAHIKPDDPHFAKSKLLCLENTLGGRLLALPYLQAACALARSKGLTTHLDGARLFNAAVAQREAHLDASVGRGDGAAADQHAAIWREAQRIVQPFDSVSVCFSKGLGAPMGSVLCGSKELIARARRIRKMAGGGLRQSGIIAAAAMYALEHHLVRLSQDHALARRLGAALAQIEGLVVEPVDSNIVFVDVQESLRDKARGLIEHLKSQGILAMGLYRLRFVTHLDVDEQGIDRTISAVQSYFQS